MTTEITVAKYGAIDEETRNHGSPFL
jgi:hypothetical protein